MFATDQAIPLHEDRYGLVERFVKDHRAVVLSSSSSNWGGGIGGGYIKHYDGYSFLVDDLVLEYDLLICEAIGNTSGSGNGQCGSWAKNALLVGGVDARAACAGKTIATASSRAARPRMVALNRTSSTSGVTCTAPMRPPRAAMALSVERAAQHRWWLATAA